MKRPWLTMVLPASMEWIVVSRLLAAAAFVCAGIIRLTHTAVELASMGSWVPGGLPPAATGWFLLVAGVLLLSPPFLQLCWLSLTASAALSAFQIAAIIAHIENGIGWGFDTVMLVLLAVIFVDSLLTAIYGERRFLSQD